MARRKSMARADAYSKKVNTGDNGGGGPWLHLNHDLLYPVMMQLRVVDYLSFGRVCESWRALAVSKRNAFMSSKPPMIMRISYRAYKKPCYLEDFEGRKFKTILPRFVGGVCIGLTCGYLIFFRKTTRVFWLVNPITRHELSFTNFPIRDDFPRNGPDKMKYARAILVFLLSICGWVFLVIPNDSIELWFPIAGTGARNSVSCTSNSIFSDLHVFKGIIYTLNYNGRGNRLHLHELRLNREPKLTLLETKNSLNAKFSQLESYGDKFYVMHRVTPDENIQMRGPLQRNQYRFQELDFGEMKWVLHETTIGEHASFLSNLKYGVVEKPMLAEGRGQGLLLCHNKGDMLKLIELEKEGSFIADMWYFPHECLNVDLVNE